jgi:hypothetical protein
MRRDELKQPLQKRSLGQRLWQQRPSALATAYAALFFSYAGGMAWLMHQPLPFAGEPQLTQAIPALEIIEPTKPAADVAAADDQNPSAENADDPANPETASTSPVTNAAGQKITKLDRYVTIISNSRPTLAKAPVAANTEDTAQGPLPQVASNGRKPS